MKISMNSKAHGFLLCSGVIFCGLFFPAGNLEAGDAYQYHNLYKNSAIYKERHPEKDSGQKQQNRGVELDGWGNLKDEPPPPDNGYEDAIEPEYNDSQQDGYNGSNSGY